MLLEEGSCVDVIETAKSTNSSLASDTSETPAKSVRSARSYTSKSNIGSDEELNKKIRELISISRDLEYR